MSALEATAGDPTAGAVEADRLLPGAAGASDRAATVARLRDLAGAVRPTTLAAERRLPVVDALAPLLPLGALQRGTLVAVEGVGATSLALGLTAAASAEGSWVGFVGTATMGWAAAAQAGVDPARTLVVTQVPVGSWATVTAALVDAVDIVVVSPDHAVRAADARRLSARARERGAVLVVLAARFAWPSEPDVRLHSTPRRWTGIGHGHGRLLARSVLVSAEGRRAAGRRRSLELWLPSTGGVVELGERRTRQEQGEAADASVLPFRSRPDAPHPKAARTG